MANELEWARGVRVRARLTSAEGVPLYDEPRTVTQLVTRNVVLCDAPLERFSSRVPLRVPSVRGEEDLRPIDVLYGAYHPETRTIEIFVESIRQDAKMFGEFADFLHVVRLHEYAHAVVHLGVRLESTVETLLELGSDRNTNSASFLERRMAVFRGIDEASHEWLAQCITLAAIALVTDHGRARRLLSTFEALEKRQTARYQVQSEIKDLVHQVNWSVLIDAARGELDVFRGGDFNLTVRLTSLARTFETCPSDASLDQRTWSVPFEDEVSVNELKSAVRAYYPGAQSHNRGMLEALVDRIGALRVQIHANEHPPPHFEVVCGRESANYEIKDCTQLNGGLRREYRAIKAWHERHKDSLIDAWNRHRPTDCPVGVYREV